MSRLPKRQDVPQAHKWKIEDIYADDTLWEEDFADLSGCYAKLGAFEGRLSESAATLFQYLNLKEEKELLLSRLIVYANQKSHEDLGEGKYQQMADRIGSLSARFYSVCAFENPEILGMDVSVLEQFYIDEPGLKKYSHYLDDIIRMQPHTLDKQMEAMLSELSDFADGPSNIFAMFNNADLHFHMVKGEDGQETQLTLGNYISFMESKDREVRKGAFETLYHTYGQFKNTLAATFASNVKKELFYADARHYTSPRAMHLDANAIDEQVYDSLINTVHAYLPAMYQYVALRKKMLGITDLHMYDVYTPIVSEVTMKFTFDEAKQTVLEGLSVLGEDYQALLEEGFTNGWIDIYENQGKRGGAYSWGTYGVHPYVLLNYQGNLDSVFTLAHEMGHALHTWHSNREQNFYDAQYSIFVAEIASTCNEVLLTKHLLKQETDSAKKAYILNHYLETFKGTIFRQTMFAEFEKKAYDLAKEGSSLTADLLCGLYHELNETYFGQEMFIDSEIDMEWARIPHFYSPFYVYQYATGLSAAVAFAKSILNEEPGALENYKTFLKGGCSKYPLDLLMDAGVDMRSGKPVADALDVFTQVVEELTELLEKTYE